MSHDATAWAFKVKGLSTSERVVLYHVANRCNEGHEGWEGRAICWPSLTKLAADTELSRRGLTKILANLEASGVVIRHHDHGYDKAYGNGGEVTIYELPIGREHSFPREHSSPPKVGNQRAKGREPECTKVGNTGSPKQVIGTGKGKVTSEFDQFWKAYPRKVGKGQASKAFKAAIKKTTLAELLAGLAIYRQNKPDYADWCHPATWLNGERWTDDYGTAPATDDKWGLRVQHWRGTGEWEAGLWGPAPDQPGTQVPSEYREAAE